jgi:hypothetical protein
LILPSFWIRRNWWQNTPVLEIRQEENEVQRRMKCASPASDEKHGPKRGFDSLHPPQPRL